jgi:citrate lyase subunit beta/citryl-CoA lyase
MLFTPGNRPRMVAKVATFGADAVILDLEDAVPLAEKEATRPVVRAALPTLAGGPPRYVRVNALETGLTGGDLEAIVCADLDGVKLPKVETADDLLEVDRLLSDLEAERGLEVGQIDLIPSIETARGVLNARSIAEAGSRARLLSFGAGDFCRDVGVRFTGNLWEPDGLELLFARSQIVLASRAAGLEPPLDTVWLDVRDNAGLEQDARALVVAGESRRPERAHLREARGRERLEVGAALDEQPRRLRAAREAREMERREPVLRPRPRELRLRREQLLEPRDPAERRRLEDRLLPRRQQLLAALTVAGVERLHRRRDHARGNPIQASGGARSTRRPIRSPPSPSNSQSETACQSCGTSGATSAGT